MDFEALADQIYEAALVPDLWPSAIQSICDESGCFGGVLFAKNVEYSGWVTSPAFGPVFQEFVEDGWAARNPRPTAVMDRKASGFVACHELFPPPNEDVDPIKGFLKTKGLGWSGGMVTPVPSGDLLVFSFERWFKDGPFTRELLDSLDGLSAHLKRAALIAGRLGLERAKAATQTMQALGLPAAVLSRANKLLVANDLFGPYVPSVVQDRFSRVRISDSRADELFERALARISRGGDLADSVQSVPIAGTYERKPLILHLVPIRRSAQDIFSAASCMLVITELAPNSGPEAEIIQGLFDLTPAEARVARAIASGSQVKEIAAEHNVSPETVKTQLKSVFAKTGVSRQADLMSMLTSASLVRD